MADDRLHTARRFLPAPNAQRPTPSRRPPATLSPVYPRGNKNLSHFCVGHCTAVGIRLCVLTAAALAVIAAGCAGGRRRVDPRASRSRPPGPREAHRPVRGRPPHRPLAAAARADRGVRGRPRIRVDRLGEHLPLHAGKAPPPPRPDRDGPARNGVVGGHRLPGAPGGDPPIRGGGRRRARAGSAARRAPTAPGPSPTTWPRSCASCVSPRWTCTATPTARTRPRCSPSGTRTRPGRWCVDAAFDNAFDPFERESSVALRAAWRAVCARAGQCPNILGSIGSLARRLAAHPITGTGTDADGVRRHVRLGPVELGSLVYDATYTYTVFRDLPGALVALRRGDRAPMLRLAAEDVAFNLPGGSPSSYSVGDYLAVACHDYPTVVVEGRLAGPARRATLAKRHPAPLTEGVRAVLEARLAPHRRRARARTGLSRLAAAADRSAAVPRRRCAAVDAGARPERRVRPVDAGRRRAACGHGLPERDARRGAEHRPRVGPLRLPALRVAHRPTVPEHARGRVDRRARRPCRP